MNFNITVNDRQWQLVAHNLQQGMSPGPLLRIAGQVMRSSVVRTFREQGSPAGSWKPLAPSTLKRGRGGAGRQILIQSRRMENSVTDANQYVISGNTLIIGSNLRYARIQQEGGDAGRKGPFKKRNGHRSRIPARPYLVFRPEDPANIAGAIERYISSTAQGGM
ncbi:MAG TPA: phage virion morphogenesis protein [Candidatus Angelobacter sp.]